MEGREEALHELKAIVWTAMGINVPPLRERKPDKSTLSARLKGMARAHNERVKTLRSPSRKRRNASQEAAVETTLPPDEGNPNG